MGGIFRPDMDTPPKTSEKTKIKGQSPQNLADTRPKPRQRSDQNPFEDKPMYVVPHEVVYGFMYKA